MVDGSNPDAPKHKALNRLKTGKFERRMGVLKLGLLTGSRVVAKSAFTLFASKPEKEKSRHSLLESESKKFVDELGEYKGSVVKIGQMMALWGEHYLPPEVTQALHQLEDNTAHMSWSIMRAVLEESLSADKINELDIDPNPIGAASLGQVHKAIRKTDGAQLCLKIQYPGVADAIDSDLDMVELLLKLSRVVPHTRDFKLWFEEIRQLLKQEVDYIKEADTVQRFANHLQHDDRYIVPKIYSEYSSNQVITMSYEVGERISTALVSKLSEERRNRIATSCIDLCWREIFEWGEMQTDPNFGNFLVRIDPNNERDQLVLLDFGAVRAFEPGILEAGKKLVKGSILRNTQMVKSVLHEIHFFQTSVPEKVINEFVDLCYLALEPFSSDPQQLADSGLFSEAGEYHWLNSRLADRVLKKASQAAFSKHFSLPPKDFMFISRKFVGAFTLMCVLKAQTNGQYLVRKYISKAPP